MDLLKTQIMKRLSWVIFAPNFIQQSFLAQMMKASAMPQVYDALQTQ
jgi:hypothetical protein